MVSPIRWLLLVSLCTAALAAPPEDVRDAKELAKEGTPPKPLNRKAPVYPYDMRSMGLTGRVEIEFIIDPTGKVLNPVVTRSNNPWFERPAIEAILTWTFTPAEVKGRKVNCRARQVLEFKIDNPRPSGPDFRNSPPGSQGDGLWYVPKLKNPEELPPILRWTVAPQPVNTAFPVYPFAALQAGQKGSTLIKFIVGPDGRVAASEVLEATTPELGLAALAMIETWSFTPPKQQDGTACFAALTMKHDFAPKGGGVPVADEARQILRQLDRHPESIAALSSLDAVPHPLSRRPPVFPTKWRKPGQTGEAIIEFFIAPSGDVQLPRIISCTEPEYGYAGVQAVATWRFEVPCQAGKPVTVRVRIPLEFKFDQPAGDAAVPQP